MEHHISDTYTYMLPVILYMLLEDVLCSLIYLFSFSSVNIKAKIRAKTFR